MGAGLPLSLQVSLSPHHLPVSVIFPFVFPIFLSHTFKVLINVWFAGTFGSADFAHSLLGGELRMVYLIQIQC